MADSKISDLPESSDPNPLSKVVVAHNSANLAVPLTSLVASAAAPKFVFYLNSTGTANSNTTSENLNFSDGVNGYQIAGTRFSTYSECIVWINKNLVSGGYVDIIFESDISEVRSSGFAVGTQSSVDVNVFGNKVIGEYLSLGATGTTPTSSNVGVRHKLTISGTAHQQIVNYIQFWNSGRISYKFIKFDIQDLSPIGRTFGLFRFSYKGAYSHMDGCTIKVDTGNSSTYVSRVIEGDGGDIFVSTTLASWRTGHDRTDPFFAGSPLATLEIQLGSTTAGIVDLFSIVRGSNSGIIDFSYAGYSANSGGYTANARVHAIGSVNVGSFCFIEAGSIFSTNGSVASRTSGGSFTASQSFHAVSFNTVKVEKYNGTITDVNGTQDQNPILPGASRFGAGNVANVDYNDAGNSSWTSSNTNILTATTYSK